jgi:hypothetical protein
MASSIGSLTSGMLLRDGSIPLSRGLGAGGVLGAAPVGGALACATAREVTARHRQNRHALIERIARIDSVES